MKKLLPRSVFEKGKWYYLVRAEGARRIWEKLSPVRDGLPGVYLALAQREKARTLQGTVPMLTADWLRDVASEHAANTRVNDTRHMKLIAEAFAEFKAEQVTPPDVATFLNKWKTKKRTFNALRSAMKDLMRYAEERGYRAAGTNPVTAIKPQKTPPRRTYITDSQFRRIKVAAIYGADGLKTRSGAMICEVLNLAYLTGQRVSDVLDLRWSRAAATKDGEVIAPYVADEGLYFQPSKTADSTGAKVLIAWTPKLWQVIERIKKISRKKQNMVYVIVTQDAQPYTYWGVNSAWKRATKRAGVTGIQLRDFRAKALTDKDATEGIQEAKAMGAHSTEKQTADYIRHRAARKTKATK